MVAVAIGLRLGLADDGEVAAGVGEPIAAGGTARDGPHPDAAIASSVVATRMSGGDGRAFMPPKIAAEHALQSMTNGP